MKKKIALLVFFMSFYGFSQESIKQPNTNNKIISAFYQFEISIPLIGNENTNNDITNEIKNRSWFLPDGFSTKFGYGYQFKKWLGLSAHSGFDWKGSYKLVAVPVYGNIRLSPGFGNGYRITTQVGFGKGFAIGRGNLSGNYTKVSLGLETDEDLIIFIEGSSYNFKLKNENSIGLISIGVALRTY